MQKRWVSTLIALGTVVWLNGTGKIAYAKEDSAAGSATADQATENSSNLALLNAAHSVRLLPLAPSTSATGPAAKPQGTRAISYSKVDIYIGYALMRASYGGRATNHGWNLEGVWNLSHHVGFTVDLSGHSGGVDVNNAAYFGEIDLDQDVYYYLFGPKLTHQIDNFQMYTHFLVGAAHGDFTYSLTPTGSPLSFLTRGKDTNFALMAGGGLDYLLTQRWAWRMLEIDFLWNGMGANGLPGSNNDLRVTTGLLFRWGLR